MNIKKNTRTKQWAFRVWIEIPAGVRYFSFSEQLDRAFVRNVCGGSGPTGIWGKYENQYPIFYFMVALRLSKLDCAVLEWFLKFKRKRGVGKSGSYILGSSTEGVSVAYIRIPSFDTLDFFPAELIDQKHLFYCVFVIQIRWAIKLKEGKLIMS